MVAESDNQGDQSGSLGDKLVAITIDLLLEPRQIKLPTMREIAQAAGVAPGAAYRHFESQAHLLLAVISELFKQLESHQAKALDDGQNPAQAIHRLAHSYVAWGTGNPGAYQLLFENTYDSEAQALGQRPGLNLVEQLALLMSQHFGKSEPDPQSAVLLWTHLHGIVSLRINKAGMPWPEPIGPQVDRAVEHALRAE